MRLKKELTVLIHFLSISLTLKNTYANPNSAQETQKILFIGSSYFNNNNLPALFKNLADSSGKKVYLDQRFPGGLYLADHANSSSTESKINEENWDYVVLQGVGRITAYPKIYTDHPVYPALVTLRDKISKNCKTTKMVFCLPWAYEDGMTWLAGWTDTYEDMQLKIYKNTLKYSDDVGFIIAPVGWAWNTVLKEKNYPLHYLHLSDWNHPSLKGSYLMACVIFTTIFNESTTNVPYYGGLSVEEANYFQAVASNTVLDSLDLWNITSVNSEKNDLSVPRKFHLHQNYPNPFNPHTNIDFEIYQPTVINLYIYNLLGEKVRTLISNSKFSNGVYKSSWNGKNDFGIKAPGGIYFCRLETSTGYHKVRKMLLLK